MDFEANSSARELNSIILIHISLRNLNFTIEKLRKQHNFLVLKGDNSLKQNNQREVINFCQLRAQMVQFVNVNCRLNLPVYYLNAYIVACFWTQYWVMMGLMPLVRLFVLHRIQLHVTNLFILSSNET